VRLSGKIEVLPSENDEADTEACSPRESDREDTNGDTSVGILVGGDGMEV